MKGWVYVISNKGIPDLIKIGYSMNDPEIRAKELDSTGLPHPYIVEYQMHVGNPQEIEQQVHHVLSPHREGKEWFRCSCKEAIEVIRKVAGEKAIYEVDVWADPDKETDSKETEKLSLDKYRTMSVDEIIRESLDLPESKPNDIETIKSVQNVRLSCPHCLKQYAVTLRRYENQAICPFCRGVTTVNIEW